MVSPIQVSSLQRFAEHDCLSRAVAKTAAVTAATATAAVAVVAATSTAAGVATLEERDGSSQNGTYWRTSSVAAAPTPKRRAPPSSSKNGEGPALLASTAPP